MRLAFPLINSLNMAWYPILMKKAYNEEQFNAVRLELQKIEDFITSNNKSETSSFSLGTENPT